MSQAPDPGRPLVTAGRTRLSGGRGHEEAQDTRPQPGEETEETVEEQGLSFGRTLANTEDRNRAKREGHLKAIAERRGLLLSALRAVAGFSGRPEAGRPENPALCSNRGVLGEDIAAFKAKIEAPFNRALFFLPAKPAPWYRRYRYGSPAASPLLEP
ncbi:MAG: hypothetical protein ACREQY_10390, partial [Candidatus Binatia bacterium]